MIRLRGQTGTVQVVGDYGSNCGNDNVNDTCTMNVVSLELITVSKYSFEVNYLLRLHKYHFTP